MYIPDHSVLRQLQSYDKHLNVRWVPKKERWGVYRSIPRLNQLYRQEILLFLVEGPNKTYRELDLRVLWDLQRLDMHRRSQASVMREYMEAQIRKEEADKKAFKDDMEQITKEVRPAIAREADRLLGATNIPKEDLRFDPDTYGAERRYRRGENRKMRQRMNRRLQRQGYAA
jgi:hypothetical protein